MIKAVIFDFGGVLLRTHDWSGRRRWEAKLGLQQNEAEAIVFNSDEGRDAQHGRISYDELMTSVGNRFSLSPAELSQFEVDFWAGDVLDQKLVALIHRLRTHVGTALISNAFGDLRRSLAQEFKIADIFDVIVISAEEGVMKPDRRLYEITLSRLGLSAVETVFIDDFQHNVEGAQAVGMAGIHFTPRTDLALELTRLGIPLQQAD